MMDEPCQPSIRMPHPGWWLLWGAVLCCAVFALRFGIPYWRTDLFLSEVKRLGGSAKTRPGGPAWVRDLIGDAAMRGFDEVTDLSLDGTSIDDEWLKQLRRFPELETLHLSGTAVGDAGMAHLTGLPRLKELSLFGTRAGDAGLEQLKRLPELRHIAA